MDHPGVLMQYKENEVDAPTAMKEGIERKLMAHLPELCVFEQYEYEDLPATFKYDGVLFFADISGFTALTERYTISSERGADALTVTLNAYIGKIVQHIIEMGGDVLKFAGDAILAVWRTLERKDLPEAVGQAVKSALIIQRNCDNQRTDVGVKLRVKIAISAGTIYTHFLGNEVYRQFAMSGRPVVEVNRAEKFCEPGIVVLSPNALQYGGGRYILVDPLPGRFGIVKYLIANPRRHWPSYIYLPTDIKYSDDIRRRDRVSMLLEPQKKREMELRKFISPVVQLKLDDEQPLKYLSEMRQCSIVFINLNFVIDPLLRDFMSLQRVAIQNSLLIIYDICMEMFGAINKIFMFDKGCTLLTIFGLPGDKHDHEQANALKAAYKMKMTLHKKISCLGTASFGVTTGNIFCGVIGHPLRHEYTVIGQKVNLAARLMMHYPDIVACDFESYMGSKLSKDVFEVLAHKEMKGVGNIKIYRYIPTQITLIGSSIVLKSKFPLIGFLAELETYERFLYQIGNVEESERCHILAVEGEAGCGKSRLSDEFGWIAGKEGYNVYSFRLCLNHRDEPHFLMRNVLEMLLETQDLSVEDKETVLLEALDAELHPHAALLNNVFKTNFEGEWEEPEVKKKHEPTNENEKSYDEDFEAEEEVAEEEVVVEEEIPEDAEPEVPVISQRYRCLNSIAVKAFKDIEKAVIVIDDAQNMDLKSWEHIFALTDNCPNIIIVMTFLPLDMLKYQIRDVLISEKSVFFQMSNLTEEEIASVACQKILVEKLPEEVKNILIERCYGVPLWCEQLLRDMQHAGVLIITPKNLTPGEAFMEELTMKHHGMLCEQENMTMACHLKPDFNLKKFSVPPAIRGIALTRLDRLLPFEQLVVKCAAVAGGVVLFDMLMELIPAANKEKLSIATKGLIHKRAFVCNIYNKTNQPLKRLNCGECDNSSDSSTGSVEEPCWQRCYCFDGKDLNADDVDQVKSATDLVVIAEKCQQLKFHNYLLQETAYSLWLEDQRKNLHKLCALHLEVIINNILVEKKVDRTVLTIYQHTQMGDDVTLNAVHPIELDMDIGSNKVAKELEEDTRIEFTDSLRSMVNGPAYVRCKDSKIFYEKTCDPEESNIAFYVMRDRSTCPKRMNELDGMYVPKDWNRFEHFGMCEELPLLVKVSENNAQRPSQFVAELNSVNQFQLHEILLFLYRDIVHHLAKHEDRTVGIIDYCLKAIQSALATSNNKLAIKYLKYTQDYIINLESKSIFDFTNEEKPITVETFFKADLSQLFGQMYYRNKLYGKALKSFQTALKIMGIPFFFNGRTSAREYWKQKKLQVKHIKDHEKYFGKASDALTEDSHKLMTIFSLMYRCILSLPRFPTRLNNAKLIALKMVNVAEATDICHTETCNAYIHLAHINQLKGNFYQAFVYEIKASQSLYHNPCAVTELDIYAMGQLHLMGCELKLTTCYFNPSLNSGYLAMSVAQKIGDFELQMKVLPMIIWNSVVLMKGTLITNSMALLKAYAHNKSNQHGLFEYYRMAMELFLDFSYVVEQPLKCINYFMRTEAVTLGSDRVTLFQMRSILTVWNYRRKEFTKALSWLKLGLEVYPENIDNVFTAKALARLTEGMICEYKRTRETTQEWETVDKTKLSTFCLIDTLMVVAERFPLIQSKAHHLKAWWYILNKDKVKAKEELTISTQKAELYNLKAEIQYAEMSDRIWFQNFTHADTEKYLMLENNFPHVMHIDEFEKMERTYPYNHLDE